MTPAGSDTASAIRARLASWDEALRAKDLDALMAHYAPEIVVFDLAPPLVYAGLAAYRANFADWFPTWDGPIGIARRDVVIEAAGGLALVRSLHRLTGRRTDGTATDTWVRATIAFRSMGGAWMIVHEHLSVPFYMEPPFRAAIDLRP